MSVYLYVILAYLLVLTGYNIYRSRQIKSQDDFMVAGRSLSLTKMVFTLVCTWIGSEMMRCPRHGQRSTS